MQCARVIIRIISVARGTTNIIIIILLLYLLTRHYNNDYYGSRYIHSKIVGICASGNEYGRAWIHQNRIWHRNTWVHIPKGRRSVNILKKKMKFKKKYRRWVPIHRSLRYSCTRAVNINVNIGGGASGVLGLHIIIIIIYDIMVAEWQ